MTLKANLPNGKLNTSEVVLPDKSKAAPGTQPLVVPTPFKLSFPALKNKGGRAPKMHKEESAFGADTFVLYTPSAVELAGVDTSNWEHLSLKKPRRPPKRGKAKRTADESDSGQSDAESHSSATKKMKNLGGLGGLGSKAPWGER